MDEIPEGSKVIPLPCPFCGCDRISARQGSTYRWVIAECDECGAQIGDVRRSSLKKNDDVAFEEWNRRTAK
jgi:Lar family restriction alleviation protein